MTGICTTLGNNNKFLLATELGPKDAGLLPSTMLQAKPEETKGLTGTGLVTSRNRRSSCHLHRIIHL